MERNSMSMVVLSTPLTFYSKQLFSNSRRIDCPVEMIDVAPTILELAGISRDEKYGFEGKSLLPVINNKNGCSNYASFSLIQSLEAFSIIEPPYEFIVCNKKIMGSKQGVHSCDTCFINLTSTARNCRRPADNREKKIAESLNGKLLEWIKNHQNRYQSTPQEHLVLTPEEIEILRSLGYVEK
jgi:hypothetical protein